MKKGISLIVLVITIIVMIIIAATIVLSISNSMIINKANEAVEQTNYQTIKDAATLAYVEYKTNGETGKLSTYVKSNLISNNILTENEAKGYVFLDNGDVIELSSLYLSNTSYYTIAGGEYSLTTAGKNAISSGEITMIAIPNGVTSIGVAAFYQCTKLERVILPEGLLTIKQAAFSGSGIKEVVIPSTVTSIITGKYSPFGQYGAFENCDQLIEISIPESITKINSYTFYGCNELSTVTLPNNLINIGERAFLGCNKLETINVPTSLTSIAKATFYNTNITGSTKTQLLAISSSCFSSPDSSRDYI